MAYRVIMPKAGMAMETGKLVKWLKEEGDIVETGEPLLEIETDKVNMEVEAMNSGILLKKIAFEGDVIPVVETIGYIGEAGEEIPEAEKAAQETHVVSVDAAEQSQTKKDILVNRADKIAATPAARRIAKEKGISLADVQASGSRGQIKAVDAQNVKPDVKSTPLAKAIAEDKGIDIGAIKGSGYAGKVTKADVLAIGTMQDQSSDEDEFVPHTAMRKVIAKRMLQSHSSIPPVTQNSIADVTKLFELRKQINGDRGNTKISINDLVIMAVAKTLREQPYVNASYNEEGMILKKHINVGVAVALEDGLIVPVIKDADKMTLSQISDSAKVLTKKAREGKLMPDEYSGGTFTISNLGMMGVTAFTPIVNSPESAILGVCAVQQQLEMDDEGNITKRLKMGLSLTYDHRSIDGAQAAIFSNRIASLLENPVSILI